MRRCACWILLVAAAMITAFCSGRCVAGGGPKNVLLIINDNSPVSQAIGAYYQQRRDIPDCNVCHIRCSTAEEVSRIECETKIVAPIRDFLACYSLPGRIDYIVLTKGIPLKATYSYSYFLGSVSVASVLTCVGEPGIVYPAQYPQDLNYRPPIVNPYGPTADSAAPEQYFTHKLSFSGRSFYAVTRLDAYAESDIYRMIDDAVEAGPLQGLFLLDGADSGSYPHISERLRKANDAIIAAGYHTHYNSADYGTKLREFVGGQQGVVGYFSWGSNENYSFTQGNYTSNRFVPGSIADTFVSYSGRTFTYPPSVGQSLIADLIPQGLSGGNGYVSEPNVNLSTYPDVLFDRYLKGYNLAESFLAATPELYWKSAVIGDPLMAPYATPPEVVFANPCGDSPLYGTILVSVNADDASGIERVEFYIDDEPVAVCTSAPYEFEWDTTGYPDGTYAIEAIAYENSPVYTQSLARTNVSIDNTPQVVARIKDLDAVEDGTLVRLTSMVVTAGTNDLSDCIYICEPERTAGVKVIGAKNVQTGTRVDVTGAVSTSDGQKVITAVSVTRHDTVSVPAPIGLANRDIGGRDSYMGPGSSSLPAGLSSTGLLIRTWGQVQQLAQDAFYISDRSIRLPTGGTGRIKVSIAGMRQIPSSPGMGTFVAVTGICALEPSGAGLMPVLRPRTPSDISYNLRFSQVSSPPGVVAPRWNLLSIPGVPTNPTAAYVLTGASLDGNLQAFDVLTQTMVTYSNQQVASFPPLCIGVGFWLQATKEYNIVTRLVAGQPDTDMWISLPVAGFTMIGHPFATPRRLDRCHVSDGSEMLTLPEAVMRGWLDSAILYWDSGSGGVSCMDVVFDEGREFQPWNGYWIRPLKPNVALIIPYGSD